MNVARSSTAIAVLSIAALTLSACSNSDTGTGSSSPAAGTSAVGGSTSADAPSSTAGSEMSSAPGASTSGAGSSAAPSGPAKKVTFVSAFNAALYFQAMKCGAESAAKKNNIELQWTGPAKWDVAEQIPMLNAATQTKPDGLIVVPTDPKALIAPIKAAVDKGITVTTVDGSLAEKAELQNIRTDNMAAGKLAGEAVVKLTGGSGKVLIVGLQPGVSANQERIDGFLEGVKGSQVQVLPTQYSQGDQGKASQIVSAAIRANPDLKAIYTTLAPASAGAASALSAAGKRGQIKLVAYDADPAQVQQLRDGIVDALVAQEPWKEGYQSVETMAKILNGTLAKDTITYQEHTSGFVITKENVDTPQAQAAIYSPECKD